jgi:D-alanyl-D-alanine-carboxypeptidase/D-alanyl-D-alanine-endopeptidase
MEKLSSILRACAFALLCSSGMPANAAEPMARQTALEGLDAMFEKFIGENHVPGLVYGVVADGQLVRVKSFGVQELKANTPVTADTVFRIASMSKQLAALATLKLRDAGKVSLDAPAENYIPELRSFKYPTADSPKITVRDLLSHGAGFVTDDPWGDRQLDMREADFTRLLERGIPFSRAPGMAYEYSNFGFALVGRLITNVAKTNYAEYVADSIIKPLGMDSSSYDIGKAPAGRRALGYRWENDAWLEEPALGPGVFGAMGGITTSANDYAKYVRWVLSAWPPRDDAEGSIVRRASVREIARPANYALVASPLIPGECARTLAYGLGTISYNDCQLGVHFGHSGGLPGFGSNVLFMPNRGLGVFAFANKTYAPASRVVREAADALARSGAFPERLVAPASALRVMAEVIGRIYGSGDVSSEAGSLALNFLLDHSAALRNRDLAELKRKLGTCQPAIPVDSNTAMSAKLAFPCERGTLEAVIVLAPTSPATLQTLEFTARP